MAQSMMQYKLISKHNNKINLVSIVKGSIKNGTFDKTYLQNL